MNLYTVLYRLNKCLLHVNVRADSDRTARRFVEIFYHAIVLKVGLS